MPASQSSVKFPPTLLSPLPPPSSPSSSSPSSARPRTTFLSLPREIRDICYDMALENPISIVVWSGVRPENGENDERHDNLHVAFWKVREGRYATADVRNTFSNLLRSNRTVAHEAAMIFYHKNQFYFWGDWSWETVVGWLLKIGPTNRAYVSQIKLQTVRPPRDWESPNRHHSAMAYALELPFARSPYLYLSLDPTAAGIVESINHAIETFSRILRDTLHGGGELTVTMSLNRPLLPGTEPPRVDRGDPTSNGFSMDLPDIMENLCERMSSIEVMWNGTMDKKFFTRAKPDIERFWEIVREKDEIWASRRASELTRFIMKWKPIIGFSSAAQPFFSNDRPLE